MKHPVAPCAFMLLLACGASPVAEPADGGRLTALEAEVGAIKNELREVRLRTLPSAELTDAEFEEVLGRELAKLEPDERAEREKLARSQRFRDQLGEEGVAKYWLQKFERQKRDDAWARPIEEACLPHLKRQTSWTLHHFECRTELCKADLTTTEHGGALPVLGEACGIGRWRGDDSTPLGASGMMTVRATVDAGGMRTIVLVVRQGHGDAPPARAPGASPSVNSPCPPPRFSMRSFSPSRSPTGAHDPGPRHRGGPMCGTLAASPGCSAGVQHVDHPRYEDQGKGHRGRSKRPKADARNVARPSRVVCSVSDRRAEARQAPARGGDRCRARGAEATDRQVGARIR